MRKRLKQISRYRDVGHAAAGGLQPSVLSVQAVHLFVVAYSLAVPDLVTITCDGCRTDINRGSCWYRNTEIVEDLDLCTTCFTSEHQPSLACTLVCRDF